MVKCVPVLGCKSVDILALTGVAMGAVAMGHSMFSQGQIMSRGKMRVSQSESLHDNKSTNENV